MPHGQRHICRRTAVCVCGINAAWQTQRIGAKLYERNITEREASIDATGKPDALRYIRTRRAMPSAERLDKIAHTLGTTADYLLGKSDIDSDGKTSGEPPLFSLDDFRKHPKNLPIYGSALGSDIGLRLADGTEVAIEQVELRMTEPLDFMARPAALAGRKHMYVLTVSGHSMEPRHDHGRRLLVDGRRNARVGDDVIVQLRAPTDDGEEVVAVLVKQLVKQRAGVIVLRQFNPPLDFEVPTERVKEVHTIVPWDDVLSF
jgi:hypothetical protein